jgi:hypothetical protein
MWGVQCFKVPAEAWRQFSLQLRNESSTSTKLQPHTARQPPIRINSKMARESPRRRRARADVPCSNPPSLKPARISRTILDTPRRLKLLVDARAYVGKMPRKELFKIHNIAERTGYYILKEGNTRHNPKVHNRDRKRILADH